MNLHVIDITTMKPQRLTAFDEDVNGYVWATSDRLLFTMDYHGNESLGLFAIDRDGQNMRVLAAPAKAQIDRGSFVLRQTQILDLLEDRPDEILVQSNERREQFTDVYLMNIRTGKKRRVEMNPGNVVGWLTDHAGVVRVGSVLNGKRSAVLYRDAEDAPWQTLAEFDLGAEDWSPLGFDYDDRTLFIASNEGGDRYAVFRYDPSTRIRGEMVFSHEAVDVQGIALSDRRRKAIAVPYYTDRLQIHWLDQEERELQEMINAALPDTLNSIQRPRHNETIALVFAASDRDPGAYYLLDVSKRELTFLLRVQEWIDPAKMASMRAVTIPARDGRKLSAYLTVPVGGDGRNLPLIINPHGGPQARDVWGYHPEVQFLANRGFAVLQVNFRGSTGYGLEFLKAGWRQWGRTMQDDLTDAVEWAVREGIARRDSVGIMGGSYGGYAVMAGLTFTPELYRFGINVVGVTDLELLLETLPRTWELARPQMEAMVGSPTTDKADLRQWSPVHHTAKIRAPLLMAYGELDPRVVLKHADSLVKELKRQKRDYEYLVFPNEGHGFRKQENIYKFYNAVDAFLAKHAQP